MGEQKATFVRADAARWHLPLLSSATRMRDFARVHEWTHACKQTACLCGLVHLHKIIPVELWAVLVRHCVFQAEYFHDEALVRRACTRFGIYAHTVAQHTVMRARAVGRWRGSGAGVLRSFSADGGQKICADWHRAELVRASH
jgi:hypothetical protein